MLSFNNIKIKSLKYRFTICFQKLFKKVDKEENHETIILHMRKTCQENRLKSRETKIRFN